MSSRWLAFSAVMVTGWMGCVHAQTASGTVTIGKDKFEMKYAAAALVRDSAEKSKTKTRIVVADQPIPADILDDEAQVWDLKSKGFHALEIEITEDKSNFSAFLIGPTMQGSYTVSGTLKDNLITVFTKQRVEGSLESAPEEHNGNMVGYSVKFAANVAPMESAPTAADAAAAAGKESTRAYLSLVAAIRTGDKQKIIEMAPPDKRSMIDTPQFPMMLKMAQEMQPKDIKVLKAVETGDSATLVARGMSDGKAQRGKIHLRKTNGKWIMESESWAAE